MKVVLDTNVLISGLMASASSPGKIVKAWRSGQFELILSEPLLDEIGRVLAYSKINKRLEWSRQQIEQFLMLLRFKSHVVDIEGVEARVPADENDNMVLATYLAANADILVSGDGDLLELSSLYSVQSPAEFSARL